MTADASEWKSDWSFEACGDSDTGPLDSGPSPFISCEDRGESIPPGVVALDCREGSPPGAGLLYDRLGVFGWTEDTDDGA